MCWLNPTAAIGSPLPYESRDHRIGLEDGVRGLRNAFSPTARLRRRGPRSPDWRPAPPASSSSSAPPSSRSMRSWTIRSMFSRPTGTWAPPTCCAPSRHSSARGWTRACGRSRPPARDFAHDQFQRMRRRAELGTAMRRFHENYDLLLTPTLPLAAFAAARARPRARQSRRRLGARSQSVQPDAATGGLRAVRTDHCRPAGGPADRRADVCRCAGLARGTCVRGGALRGHCRAAAATQVS